MTAAKPTPREMRKPEFPAVVHTYTDALRELVDGPHSAEALAQATDRLPWNVKRDVHKLQDAGVIADAGNGKWALTDKGRRWVDGADVAEGKALSGGEQTALLIQLIPDPDQPRKAFDEEAMCDLADSIADKGLLQPILVRPAGANGLHMIVAGERRYRALGRLAREGLWPGDKPVPIRIATPEDEAEAMELALVENTQRTDLNHMELAQGYQRLSDLGRTPKQIAAVVGRTNDHVTQHLRLTRLPADVQPLVADGRVTFHEGLELERLLRDRDADDDPAVVEIIAGLIAGPLSPGEAIARLREGDARKADQPPVEWTVNDVRKTPFGLEDGDVEPLITLWQMTDDRARYRIDYAVSLGGTVIRREGNEALPNPDLAMTRAIAGLRLTYGSRLPRPAVEWLDRLQGPHVVDGVDYYNAARAQEARYTLGWDERKANSGGGHTPVGSGPTLADLTSDPAQQIAVASAPADSLSARARLALVELAHKVAVERRPLTPADDPAWSGDREADHAAFGASVGTFWLDGAHGELTATRLASFAHVRGGLPPIASLTPAGVALLIDAAIDLPVDDRALEQAQLASGLGVTVGVTYETPWLEQVAQPHLPDADAVTDAEGMAPDDDPWGRTPEQIAEDERLDAQVAQLALGEADVANLFADFGIVSAQTHERSDDDIGIVFLLDGNGSTITTVTVDQPGELPASRVRAIADLVAHQLNAVLG